MRSQWRVSQPLSAFQIRNECGVPSYASTESLRNPCDGKRVTDPPWFFAALPTVLIPIEVTDGRFTDVFLVSLHRAVNVPSVTVACHRRLSSPSLVTVALSPSLTPRLSATASIVVAVRYIKPFRLLKYSISASLTSSVLARPGGLAGGFGVSGWGSPSFAFTMAGSFSLIDQVRAI